MIDGVKIELPSYTATGWLSNKLLNFYTSTNVDTGEMLDNTTIAKYRGLVFYIIQSTKYEGVCYCYIRGSLHKYFNNGKHNYNDFTFNDLNDVINDLSNKFNISPETAILRNVEFGVNIYTPITTKQLLSDLVAYGNYTFGTLTIEKIRVGKKITKQQSELKIYDKGKQYKTDTSNLTRIELAIKKMQYLKKYGIKTLADLTNEHKIKPLGDLLRLYWDDIIYFDKKINYKHLTAFQQKKLLYYATPRNWADFTRMQRMRAKKHFNELVKIHGSNTHADISNLIAQKWAELSAQKCIRINQGCNELRQTKNVYDLTLKINSYNVYKTTLKKNNQKSPKNTTKKRRVCVVCKTNISHKKVGAKYCSKKCNNQLNGMKRTKKRQKRIRTEKEQLQKLSKLLPKNKLDLIITYKTDTGIYSDQLQQNEIHTDTNWIKKVQSVSVSDYRKNAPIIILTSYRARKLINLISSNNILKKEQRN